MVGLTTVSVTPLAAAVWKQPTRAPMPTESMKSTALRSILMPAGVGCTGQPGGHQFTHLGRILRVDLPVGVNHNRAGRFHVHIDRQD